MTRIARLKTTGVSVTLAVSRSLAPARRQELIARHAREGLAESQTINAAALGRVPEHNTFVDGRPEAPLETVNPDRGVVLFVFQLATQMFEWIEEQLIIHSPVGNTPKSPEYSKSHVFFADGQQSDPAAPAKGDVFVFLSTVPYARKIERGQSSQAPDGVYEGVAALASRRFGNIASIRFGFRSFQAGAIVYNPGKFDLRRQLQNSQGMTETDARRAASKIIKRERDTRQPAIIVTMR